VSTNHLTLTGVILRTTAVMNSTQNGQILRTHLMAVGASCLAIVQQAAHAYLKAWVLEIGGKEVWEAKLPGDGWFGKCRTSSQVAKIDLEPCAAAVAIIEHASWRENDFIHNDDLLDTMTMQR